MICVTIIKVTIVIMIIKNNDQGNNDNIYKTIITAIIILFTPTVYNITIITL